ncbi:MAG: N-acetylmuramoyl-L-alanine amidase [Thermosipho sp. (in: Bacteria)]|nr:N-acetylmuramoyl-L-alanine amidase [Thermosipho sp. (in: thermotogales)]
MKIIIDAGHGGKDNGGGTNKYFKEKDMTLKISLYQYKRFKELGIDVELTRDKDIYLPKNERTKKVKNSNADICISNHINNALNKNAKGAEVIHSIYSDGKLANMILDELVNAGATKRRVFCKSLPYNPKKDYYYMHRETGKVQTVIVEYGFASNEEDTKKILNHWKDYAEAVIRAVCRYIDYDYKTGTPILGEPKVTLEQMEIWAKNRGATDKFISAAKVYYKYGKLTGIRPDILYCQAAKETAFGNFGGAVTEDMNNFAGIKIKNPTGDKKSDHETFPTLDDGVRGHFNHMCAYVGISPIGQPHDRYYVVKSLSWAGTIKFVEELGGKWCPNKNYGYSILNDYYKDLLNTDIEEHYKNLYYNLLNDYQMLKKDYIKIKKVLSDIKLMVENIE